ncbi:hypothetical protein V2J56_14615 [Georgenia sp. MJ206]
MPCTTTPTAPRGTGARRTRPLVDAVHDHRAALGAEVPLVLR